jgi:hypothetical protein
LLTNSSNKILLSDLLRLNSAVIFDDFNIKQFLPLLNVIFWIQPNKVIWEKVYAIIIKSISPPQPLPLYI